MTWLNATTILLAVGMLLAEYGHSRILKREPDNPHNGAGLYAFTSLFWPGVVLYLLGYLILKGRWSEK